MNLEKVAQLIKDHQRGLISMAEYQMALYDLYIAYLDNAYHLANSDSIEIQKKTDKLVEQIAMVESVYSESESFYHYESIFDVSHPYITLGELEFERDNSNKYEIWLQAKYSRLNRLIVESGLTS